MVYEFTKNTIAHNYIFEKELSAGEEIIVKIPRTSPGKEEVIDIGWICSDGVCIYATLSHDPESESALWQELEECCALNKTVSAVKVCAGNGGRVYLRAMLA